ncbi:MAG: hypothetical protein GTN67_10920 [Hydrotalea flava]|nr:hypothetical protein [Hydrotalea flava]RTL47291.1 MAG: hypothetical protein EKK39_14580 [Sphingobacteriales bacterium]NIM38706.1 hypothetical protein [Hydrotalea flava]NIN03894.1 hypothetical protein [Hydrotalea flava]NIN15615.1 hypothetical protein [Hydrotalea flava]
MKKIILTSLFAMLCIIGSNAAEKKEIPKQSSPITFSLCNATFFTYEFNTACGSYTYFLYDITYDCNTYAVNWYLSNIIPGDCNNGQLSLIA